MGHYLEQLKAASARRKAEKSAGGGTSSINNKPTSTGEKPRPTEAEHKAHCDAVQSAMESAVARILDTYEDPEVRLIGVQIVNEISVFSRDIIETKRYGWKSAEGALWGPLMKVLDKGDTPRDDAAPVLHDLVEKGLIFKKRRGASTSLYSLIQDPEDRALEARANKSRSDAAALIAAAMKTAENGGTE